MSIEINGVTKRIGLSLSGGGFRAAAFHLGVMRHLEQRGLLAKLDVISCVSGGSIAGAFIALRGLKSDALDDLAKYLRTRSIAVAAVLGGSLNPFESRLDKLADSYDADLFKGASLKALAMGPRVYLNATNIATGNMFSFIAGGGDLTEMGDWELGFCGAEDFPLSRAVAASSAFPPVFPPLLISSEVYPSSRGLDYITLTDGGVYDNLGVNPLVTRRNHLDYLIISDGGKPFAIDHSPTESGLAVLKAALDILMEQVRGLEFDRVDHRHKAGVGAKPLWFSIDSEIGESRPGDAAFASSISTNLKALSAAEMDVLQRHGAALVAHRLSNYAPQIP